MSTATRPDLGFIAVEGDGHEPVTRDEYELQSADISDQIVAYADGRPITVVNPDVLGAAR
jgi:hypothetical protein